MKPLMQRNEDHRPWGLILALCLAAVAGVMSVPLQIIAVKSINAASAADIERAAALTEQLTLQQRQDAAEAKAFREDSRRLTLAICDQIEAVAKQAQLTVPPCPRVATNPLPQPAPDIGP